IDTRTVGAGVDEHRQVVVIGDPATASAVGTVTATGGLRVEPYMTNTLGTGVAGFQQEDQPHVDGHAGVMILGVRNHFTGSTTDGDYAACDTLWIESPFGSDYESFAETCGTISEESLFGSCELEFG
ncbi:MAG: hypothetical protein EBY52_02180, partial [Actinobacteria bacterium]|nr:hypothetical protein [Actinomycetota bacterium]